MCEDDAMNVREFFIEGADLERANLVRILREEDELRRLWSGHLEELNPDARPSWERSEMRKVKWYAACVVGIVLYVAWICTHN
jgi:hypothetical protein